MGLCIFLVAVNFAFGLYWLDAFNRDLASNYSKPVRISLRFMILFMPVLALAIAIGCSIIYIVKETLNGFFE